MDQTNFLSFRNWNGVGLDYTFRSESAGRGAGQARIFLSREEKSISYLSLLTERNEIYI